MTLLEIFSRRGVIRFSDSSSRPFRRRQRRVPADTRFRGGTWSQSFQKLPTLADQLTYALLFRQTLCRIQPVLPTRAARSCQTLRGTRARAGAPVHPTSTITHCGRLTCRATTRPGSAPRSGVRVTWRIPILQPALSRRLRGIHWIFRWILHDFLQKYRRNFDD